METHPTAMRAWRARRRDLYRKVFIPAPRLTLSQWADKYRVLSRSASAEPGQYRTNRFPPLRGIMDAMSDPRIEQVVVMKSAQVGYTEALVNCVGYYIHQDPSPILVVQPSVDMGRAWSIDKLAPALADSPVLKDSVQEPRSRDSGNTILHKVFTGGHLTVVGANAPAPLASRTIRVVLVDEEDRFPDSAGDEGDPVSLAEKRKLKGFSHIERAYNESDQRVYMVPCPDCGHKQRLLWKGLIFDSKNFNGDVTYCCENCASAIPESKKRKMVADKEAGGDAEWVALNPTSHIVGFHISALYSPWITWAKIVTEFLAAKGSPTRLQTWTNTVLGETWEVMGEAIEPESLMARRENYRAEVPHEVGILVAGVDVQGDRLELNTWGIGIGEESWSIRSVQLWGDPGTPDVWNQLDRELLKPYKHEGGREIRIQATAIDTGGHNTDAVYRFVAPRQGRHVIAIKGVGGDGAPLLGRPGNPNSMGVLLFPVGTITAKDIIFSRLRIAAPGPGYVHFPMDADTEWFAQLTAEKVVGHISRGRRTRTYEPMRPRNEALDMLVYALAAFTHRGRVDLVALVKELNPEPEPDTATNGNIIAAPEPPAITEIPTTAMRPPVQRPAIRRGGRDYMNSWRF